MKYQSSVKDESTVICEMYVYHKPSNELSSCKDLHFKGKPL